VKHARLLNLGEHERYAWFLAALADVDKILEWCRVEYGACEIIDITTDPYNEEYSEHHAVCYYHDATFRVVKGPGALAFMLRWC
jgi:hypothetical protein